jgi:hypothetical protein
MRKSSIRCLCISKVYHARQDLKNKRADIHQSGGEPVFRDATRWQESLSLNIVVHF